MQSTLKLTEMLYLFSMVLTQQHIQTHQTIAKKTSWMKNYIFRRQTETGKCRLHKRYLNSSIHQFFFLGKQTQN